MSGNMTYAGVGVDYDAMDPFKRMAQLAGSETASNIARLNGGEFKEFVESRGESAYLIEAAKSYLAHVEEGLGTKNLVADAMYRLTGRSYYDHIAQCAVAMIVNDMITLGALPLSVAMHLAVGHSSWFDDQVRCQDLVNGWKKACDLAGCVWGGGETPTLKGVVVPDAVVLSGSAVGMVKPKERLIHPNRIQDGDQIIILDSSGIHANGVTLAREIETKLPEGYLTKISDGRTYGEALLDPTRIYVGIVEACLDAGIDIHYLVNITGHGWRKLMRAPQSFAYVVEYLPPIPPVLQFIQKHGPIDDCEAYGNLNMGAGFAIFASRYDAGRIMAITGTTKKWPSGYGVMHVGHIEKSNIKKVVIKPKGLEYLGSTLGVR